MSIRNGLRNNPRSIAGAFGNRSIDGRGVFSGTQPTVNPAGIPAAEGWNTGGPALMNGTRDFMAGVGDNFKRSLRSLGTVTATDSASNAGVMQLATSQMYATPGIGYDSSFTTKSEPLFVAAPVASDPRNLVYGSVQWINQQLIQSHEEFNMALNQFRADAATSAVHPNSLRAMQTRGTGLLGKRHMPDMMNPMQRVRQNAFLATSAEEFTAKYSFAGISKASTVENGMIDARQDRARLITLVQEGQVGNTGNYWGQVLPGHEIGYALLRPNTGHEFTPLTHNTMQPLQLVPYSIRDGRRPMFSTSIQPFKHFRDNVQQSDTLRSEMARGNPQNDMLRSTEVSHAGLTVQAFAARSDDDARAVLWGAMTGDVAVDYGRDPRQPDMLYHDLELVFPEKHTDGAAEPGWIDDYPVVRYRVCTAILYPIGVVHKTNLGGYSRDHTPADRAMVSQMQQYLLREEVHLHKFS